ncbi:histidine decarboxylase [Aquimarina agarilytica]|uniref:histidine decarboxylase n=1 Tax=Aquimarina agarilytica TaxID=1087449 RepID=UPI000287CC4B|nr:histidine decarboxylase [Aquimarina agarilytica]
MENLTLTMYDQQLRVLNDQLNNYRDKVLGYPISSDFDFSELYSFLKFSINNIGDPFEDCNYRVQTTNLEKEVIGFFASLFNADPNDYWGYITNGGSENNLCGLHTARKLYPNGVVYYADAAHYSVPKSIDILNMKSSEIATDFYGEMDYQDLEIKLAANKDYPAIFSLNFGSTMTEAKDNVEKVKKVIQKCGVTTTYIHIDGALSGSYGAFIEPRIPFDFSDGIDSICLSAHKFLGSPMPAGVFITKKSIRNKTLRPMEVIDSYDSTVTGSRNGHTPLFLWYTIKKMGVEGLKNRYLGCLEVTNYCVKQLNEIGIECWVNPGGITVFFRAVSMELKKKWQLATVAGITHIICMPNVTKQHIDAFIKDVILDEKIQCVNGPIL